MCVMNGSEWLTNVPEKPGTDRDHMILDGVIQGILYCEWVPVTSSIDGHTGVFYVSDDAVRTDLEDGSRFRPQCTATLNQTVADHMHASMFTTKLMDLSYQQANVKLPATILTAGPDMVLTSRSKMYNVALDKKRNGKDGLVRDCGKAWVLSNKLGSAKNAACNYGFYDPHAPYSNARALKMWQTLGSRHDSSHEDYSQVILLVKQDCEVDGVSMKFSDVLSDKSLCNLVSDEGVIKFVRQP